MPRKAAAHRRTFGNVLRQWARAVSSTVSWSASAIGIGNYNFNDPRRKILSQGRRPKGNITANQLAVGDFPSARAYSRHLERNHATARAAVDGLVALIVGTGISLEPDLRDAQGNPLEKANAAVRKAWMLWCERATADGRSFYELQQQGCREMIIAGELLWRWVTRPERKGIKSCILPLESEWLDENAGGILSQLPNGNWKLGPLTCDAMGVPVSYDLTNPDSFGGKTETVPAREIIHTFEKRRSMQMRGEPWMSASIEVMQQERDLVDSELQTAKNCASLGIAVTSEYHQGLDETEEGTSDDPAMSLRIGGVARLFPGEKVESFKLDRPSQQIAAFRGMLRGDIAASMRLPQRFLDRDVSRANYSSMRADNLDEERLIGPVRQWFAAGTVGRAFLDLLPQLCVMASVPVPAYAGYRVIPDEQPYVDPQKDVSAAEMSIGANLSTLESEIGKRGGDWREVLRQRDIERETVAIGEIQRLQSIQNAINKANADTPGLNLQWAQVATIGGATTAPGAYLAAATGNQTAVAKPDGEANEPADDAEDDDDGDDEPADDAERMARARYRIGPNGEILGVRYVGP